MQIKLPENVKYIISELENAGFEAYAVGGCVRDSILGRIPGDWDITTSALPGEVKSIFKYTVDTGIEHGTVTVKIKNDGVVSAYEVTTYRVDGEYLDMRHPKSVEFTRSLDEDLKRRDFTINAMAYNERDGIIDLFDGTGDIKRKTIRCVGSADERFNEDALRMLRAVRFAAQLGFSIEENTKKAIVSNAHNLSAVSKERIYTEINKLICSAHIDHIYLLNELGLSEYSAKGMRETLFSRLSDISLKEPADLSERYLRYAYLFAGQSAETVKKILKELKSDNDTLEKASKLAASVFKKLPEDRYGLKTSMSGYTRELFEDLLQMKEVFGRLENLTVLENLTGKTSNNPAEKFSKSAAETVSDEKENLSEIKRLYKDITDKNEPVYIKDLAVTGTDLIISGIKKGPVIGEVLDYLIDIVRNEPGLNKKEILLQEGQAFFNKKSQT